MIHEYFLNRNIYLCFAIILMQPVRTSFNLRTCFTQHNTTHMQYVLYLVRLRRQTVIVSVHHSKYVLRDCCCLLRQHKKEHDSGVIVFKYIIYSKCRDLYHSTPALPYMSISG
jgi:hypothetical protein